MIPLLPFPARPVPLVVARLLIPPVAAVRARCPRGIGIEGRTGLIQPEWSDDAILEEGVSGHARHGLDDVAEGGVVEVGVAELAEGPRRLPGAPSLNPLPEGIVAVDIAAQALEPASVGEQVADRRALVARETGEVTAHGVVERELPLIGEHEDGRRHKRLRHRLDREDRVPLHRTPFLTVAPAIGLVEDGPPAFHDQQLGPNEVPVRHPLGDLVAEPLQLLARESDLLGLFIRKRRRLDAGEGMRAGDLRFLSEKREARQKGDRD